MINENKMNVFMLSCPGADPAMPHAALPALGAQLRADGICDYFLQDLHRAKYRQIIRQIESLYPNLKLMDISREILYLARFGKQVLKKPANM